MKTLYLKTNTEQEMIDVLTNYGFYDDTWKSISYYNDKRIDIDVLGTIVRITSTDPDNIETETLDGFHVNLIWNEETIPEDLQTIMIEKPTTPERVFFGIE